MIGGKCCLLVCFPPCEILDNAKCGAVNMFCGNCQSAIWDSWGNSAFVCVTSKSGV